jgi:hypothetical protein
VADDVEGMAKECAGVADVSGGDGLADAARGDGAAAQVTRRVDVYGEAELFAEGFERVDAGFGLVAEAKVFSFVQLFDVEGVAKDLFSEVMGG